MRLISLIAFCLFFHNAKANETLTAEQFLNNMASAVKLRNFDASFVVLKGKGMEPYNWAHANTPQGELELLSLLNGAGLEIVRVGDRVTYYEPQSQAYSVQTDSIAGPIPEVLFKDFSKLKDNYTFVLGGKGRIAGRPAQLIRIQSIDNSKYNYWLWIDTQSSLILKSAYVTQKGELVEQLQLTHISVTPDPAPKLLQLLDREFPKALPDIAKQNKVEVKDNWNITWLPKGFRLLKSDRRKLDLNNELADYYLFTDGLIEVSVFVQRPLAGKSLNGSLSSGATTVYIHSNGAFDVSVVGKIPPATAKLLAESVKRAL